MSLASQLPHTNNNSSNNSLNPEILGELFFKKWRKNSEKKVWKETGHCICSAENTSKNVMFSVPGSHSSILLQLTYHHLYQVTFFFNCMYVNVQEREVNILRMGCCPQSCPSKGRRTVCRNAAERTLPCRGDVLQHSWHTLLLALLPLCLIQNFPSSSCSLARKLREL